MRMRNGDDGTWGQVDVGPRVLVVLWAVPQPFVLSLCTQSDSGPGWCAHSGGATQGLCTAMCTLWGCASSCTPVPVHPSAHFRAVQPRAQEPRLVPVPCPR